MSSPQGRPVSLRVLFQMFTVAAYSGVAKVAGAVKVVFVARAFGMSDGLDAYFIAFLLPSFVSDTLAASLLSALVPAFVEVRAREGQDAANRLYQSALAASVALLAAVSVVIGVFAPWIFRLLASSFDAPKLALTCSLFWIMLPIVVLSGFGTVWRALLNVEGRFALPAVVPVATPLLSIALLFAVGQSWGVYTLAIGTVVGCLTENILIGITLHRRGYSNLPRWHGPSAALRQVATQYGPLLAGVLLLGGAPVIDQAIAGMLASGSVAALSYGTRLSTVLVAIGPSAVATAILPHFSKLSVTEDWTHIRQSLRSYAIVILSVTVPVIAFFIAFSEPLVRIFFQRGQFTGSDTSIVATIQRYSLLQIPMAMVMALALRLVSSMKANRLLVRVAVFYWILNLALDLLFTRFMGVAGIALSTAVVQLAALLYLLWLMRTHLPANLNPIPSRAVVSP